MTQRFSSKTLSLLRIMAGLLFLEHGLMKIFYFPAAAAGLPSPLPPLMMAAGVIELIGGALLTLGLVTRPVAFVCAGEMAAAYFMAHAPASLWPGINGGEAAILYCFVFLHLACAGGGDLSVDAALVRARSGSSADASSRGSMRGNDQIGQLLE
jgi:putative oxidoreductase